MTKPPPAGRQAAAAAWPLLQTAALLLVALLLWKLAGVLLLAFSAVLLALAFAALADGLRRIFPLPRGVAVGLAAAAIVGVLGAVVALFGWRIVDQYEQVVAKAREGVAALVAFAHAHAWSQALLQRADGARIADATDALAPLGSMLGAASRYLAYGAIVLVSGIFLALDPDRYLRSLLRVTPPGWRPRLDAFLGRSSQLLRRWLVSRLIVMAAIGVLVSLGLTLLGIEDALILGLTGALLTFIPFIGALLATVPAVLVALTVSPWLAGLTALMFWAVHFIEGTFITPVVQDEEVNLPPVLTIFSTLGFTVIFGPSGVILASPLVVVILAAIQVFYLEGRLGEPPPASPGPRRLGLGRRSASPRS